MIIKTHKNKQIIFHQPCSPFHSTYLTCQYYDRCTTKCLKWKYCHCQTCIETQRPGDACMQQWTRISLVQVMACHLFVTKPWLEPMLTYCQLFSVEKISKTLIEIQTFSFTKIHHVQASMCENFKIFCMLYSLCFLRSLYFLKLFHFAIKFRYQRVPFLQNCFITSLLVLHLG